MPYVKRDVDGVIVSVGTSALDGHTEILDALHPDLLVFQNELFGMHAEFVRSDLEFVRVVEDLLQLLLDKNVVLFTELPPAARRKLLDRQFMRRGKGDSLDLLDDETAPI